MLSSQKNIKGFGVLRCGFVGNDPAEVMLLRDGIRSAFVSDQSPLRSISNLRYGIVPEHSDVFYIAAGPSFEPVLFECNSATDQLVNAVEQGINIALLTIRIENKPPENYCPLAGDVRGMLRKLAKENIAIVLVLSNINRILQQSDPPGRNWEEKSQLVSRSLFDEMSPEFGDVFNRYGDLLFQSLFDVFYEFEEEHGSLKNSLVLLPDTGYHNGSESRRLLFVVAEKLLTCNGKKRALIKRH